MFLRKIISSYLSSNFAFFGFKVSVTNDLPCAILLSQISFWTEAISVLDGCYFQTSKIITKSIRIICKKVDISSR